MGFPGIRISQHSDPLPQSREKVSRDTFPDETAAAKERQGTRTDLLDGNVSFKSLERRKETQARDKAGERVGVSGKSIDKATIRVAHNTYLDEQTRIPYNRYLICGAQSSNTYRGISVQIRNSFRR